MAFASLLCVILRLSKHPMALDPLRFMFNFQNHHAILLIPPFLKAIPPFM